MVTLFSNALSIWLIEPVASTLKTAETAKTAVTAMRLALTVATFCTVLLVSDSTTARDDGQFAYLPLKQWSDQLASVRG